MPANWKTSVAGVGTVLAGLATLATMLSTGQVDANALGTAILGIASGVGLILAKDAKS